jgi:hypothetical protein
VLHPPAAPHWCTHCSTLLQHPTGAPTAAPSCSTPLVPLAHQLAPCMPIVSMQAVHVTAPLIARDNTTDDGNELDRQQASPIADVQCNCPPRHTPYICATSQDKPKLLSTISTHRPPLPAASPDGKADCWAAGSRLSAAPAGCCACAPLYCVGAHTPGPHTRLSQPLYFFSSKEVNTGFSSTSTSKAHSMVGAPGWDSDQVDLT